MATRSVNFAGKFLHLFWIISFHCQQASKTNNRIHRRAYIVRHIGQKAAFSLIGHAGCVQSLAQHFIHTPFLRSVRKHQNKFVTLIKLTMP